MQKNPAFQELITFNRNESSSQLLERLWNLSQIIQMMIGAYNNLVAELLRRARSGRGHEEIPERCSPRKDYHYHPRPTHPDRVLADIDIFRQTKDAPFSFTIPVHGTLTPSRQVGYLLYSLACDKVQTADALVGWKSRTQVCSMLTQLQGSEFKMKHLNALVHRLRTYLDKFAGRGGDLVLVDRTGSMGNKGCIRLALKHRLPATSIAAAQARKRVGNIRIVPTLDSE